MSSRAWRLTGIAISLLIGLSLFTSHWLPNGGRSVASNTQFDDKGIEAIESEPFDKPEGLIRSSGEESSPSIASARQNTSVEKAFSGFVTDGFGEPISGATVTIHDGRTKGRSWRDGSFYLPNHEGIHEVQLVVSHPYFISATVLAIAGFPVTVTLESTWRLEGQFLLDPGLNLDFIEVILMTDSPEESGNEPYDKSLLSESGHFSFSKVQPGEYEILLRGMWAECEIFSTDLFLNNIGGVKEIPIIDLRGRLKRIRILVMDEFAEEISLAAAYDLAWNDITHWSEEGLEIYALDEEAILGRVCASGFLDTEVMELSDGITVEMKKGIGVELSLSSFPPPPEGWEWGFSLIYTKDGSIEGAPSIAPVSLHDGWGIVSRPGAYFVRLDLIEMTESNGFGPWRFVDLGEQQTSLLFEVPDGVSQYSANVLLSADCSRVIAERIAEIAIQNSVED